MARALLTTVQIKVATFVSGLHFGAQPAYPKRLMTTSSTKVGIKAMCLHIELYSSADEVKSLGRVLKSGCYSDTDLSAMACSVS